MGLLGGLAIFLFGMEQMTDALKSVVGSSMSKVGGGATYGFVDLGGLEINGVDIPDFGDADDEFGWFGRLGYRMPVGFFAEVLYRDLDVSIENLRPILVPLVGNSIDVDMGGWQINLGWRW